MAIHIALPVGVQVTEYGPEPVVVNDGAEIGNEPVAEGSKAIAAFVVHFLQHGLLLVSAMELVPG